MSDRARETGVRRPVLVTILALWLACPPTADAKAVPKQPWRLSPSASVYHHFSDLERGELEAVPVAGLEIGDLPLWDLDATLAVLDREDPEAPWVTWVIATAQGRPATAHSALVVAFASDELSAARLAWWWIVSPRTLDSLDALLEAYDRAVAPSTQALLAAAIARSLWKRSCPVALAADGACRVPGSPAITSGQALVRREPITAERARHWTTIAAELRRKGKFAADDLAVAELFAELAIAAHGEAYEGLLGARMPEDLDFTTYESWAESKDPRTKRNYARQVERAAESNDRYDAFLASHVRCWTLLYEDHSDAVRTAAKVAILALLREATVLLLAAMIHEDYSSPSRRDHDRILRENPKRFSTAHASDYGYWHRTHAREAAARCVEIGTTLAGQGAVVDACRRILDARHDEPILELVPEPRSTSVMQTHGVVNLE